MSTATKNDEFINGASIGTHQQSLILNIDLLPDEDLFTIVDSRIDDIFQRGRLERFRDLCRRLVLDPPVQTSPVEWHHLVALFCVFQDFSSKGRDGGGSNLITSRKVNMPEVSTWFKEGQLPCGSLAYICHNQSWQAVIIPNSISDYYPDLIWNKNLSSPGQLTKFNNNIMMNEGFFSNGQIYSSSTPVGSNFTTHIAPQKTHTIWNAHRSAESDEKKKICSLPPRQIDEIYNQRPDRVDSAIHLARSFYGSLTRTSGTFEPIHSHNTSPTLSTISFNTQLTSLGNSPPNFPSKTEIFPQKNNQSHPFVPHIKKMTPRNISNESIANSLIPLREPKEFFTCRSLLGIERRLTAQQTLLATASGLDLAKYKGDITAARIRDQLLPESENCSLRIIDIHPDISDKELFQMIDTGKVYFYQRLPSKMGVHFTCAANLAFFDRYSAEKFYRKCAGWPGIWLGGYRIKALWNRDKSSPPLNSHISRVVTVYGSASLLYGKEQFLSRKGLEAFFNGKFHFLLVDAVEWMIDSVTKAVRLEFGSARCQGQFARISLNRFIRHNNLHEVLGVEYSVDPCQER